MGISSLVIVEIQFNLNTFLRAGIIFNGRDRINGTKVLYGRYPLNNWGTEIINKLIRIVISIIKIHICSAKIKQS